MRSYSPVSDSEPTGRPRHSWNGAVPRAPRVGAGPRDNELKLWTRMKRMGKDLAERAAYQFTRLLEASLGMKLFVLWCISATLVGLGASLLHGSGTTASWSDALFRSYALLHNAPGTSAWEYDSYVSSFLANSLFITGMLTFAVTIGTVSSSIHAVLEEVWKADHKIVESNHIVVINWGTMIIPILRQILELGDGDGVRPRVVLLADQDPETMRNLVVYELGAMSKRILVRSGNPSSIRNLQKVSAGSASQILVLTPHYDADVSAHGSLKSMLSTQIACIRSLQQMDRSGRAHGVVVTPRESAPDMLMGFNLITPTSFQQHVLATATLQRGLTSIYQV